MMKRRGDILKPSVGTSCGVGLQSIIRYLRQSHLIERTYGKSKGVDALNVYRFYLLDEPLVVCE